MKSILTLLCLALFLTACTPPLSSDEPMRVLVFSKTLGWRHASIEPGVAAIHELGAAHGFEVMSTEDAEFFTERVLRDVNVVVFMNTTGDVLDAEQQYAFQRFIQAGGGYVGVHSAADTEYDWPWYNELVGGYFVGHPNNPNVREGTIQVADTTHASTKMLPTTWVREDEWYDYQDRIGDVNVLLNVDEASYKTAEEDPAPEPRPIAWYRAFDGGRMFYTGLGHTAESYSEPLFLDHLLGGIRYAAGSGALPDYTRDSVAPEWNRFTKEVLAFNLNEPMELDLLPDGRILFIERAGVLHLHDPETDTTTPTDTLDVFTTFEDGLMGLAVDPNFEDNNWLYLYYSNPGDEPIQRLSRFTFRDDQLDMASEEVLLTVTVQREECCHAGGSVEFDAAGNLYLSTGDNTNPHASDGYAPIDERPERGPWDAQKSSANPNDLRGKILRITPQPDGGYTIPEGNLFAPGTPGTRPEIYVMGNRNPFRMSIDDQTGFLYWGEVGPDAGQDGMVRGPRGHDEVNQARQAGNFGWPYFVGDNKAYHDYDFATQATGAPFDPAAPVNDSPNNTGTQTLPPAQPALIWYPYADSPEFPLLGTGGRNAMAGPVYYADAYRAENRLPAYFDGKLFIYDWMRGWIMTVTMDDNHDYVRMEPFMPGTGFSSPMDMLIGPDGWIYMLEYGTKWFSRNLDARLVRIRYTAGNRMPVAQAQADRDAGAAPLTVQFSADGSTDFDADDLSYQWTFDGDASSSEANPTFTYETPGTYTAELTVTDEAGASATQSVDILVGNDPAAITLAVDGNRSFYWDDTPLTYSVRVADTEDGTLGDGIAAEQVTLSVDYLAEGNDLIQPALGHLAQVEAANRYPGAALIADSDCAACHQPRETSIGPSYLAVAERYAEDDDAPSMLVQKIIQGGGGNWGDQAMAAHPQLTEEEAAQMVDYILSFADDAPPSLPLSGTYAFTEHPANDAVGSYIFMATYTDRGGNGVGPLTAREMITLRPARLLATQYTTANAFVNTISPPDGMDGLPSELLAAKHEAEVVYANLDLTGIEAIEATVAVTPYLTRGGTIAVHLGSADGPLLGTFNVEPPTQQEMQTLRIPVGDTEGMHDLVMVYQSATGDRTVCYSVAFEFEREQGI